MFLMDEQMRLIYLADGGVWNLFIQMPFQENFVLLVIPKGSKLEASPQGRGL